MNYNKISYTMHTLEHSEICFLSIFHSIEYVQSVSDCIAMQLDNKDSSTCCAPIHFHSNYIFLNETFLFNPSIFKWIILYKFKLNTICRHKINWLLMFWFTGLFIFLLHRWRCELIHFACQMDGLITLPLMLMLDSSWITVSGGTMLSTKVLCQWRIQSLRK